MTPTHNEIDPYSPSNGYFECLDCGHRESGVERLADCPECAGEVRNIAVARE
ncbi:hypothetical protein JCM17823_02090 [Halorubrum gandharaense]